MDTLIQLLYAALSEEFQQFYQYFITKDILTGQQRHAVSESFTDFAVDELHDHAQKLIDRLIQLGEKLQPIQSPMSWPLLTKNSFKLLSPNCSVLDAILLNIETEEAAIKRYEEIITAAEALNDQTTAEVARQILLDEQEHKQELIDFRDDIDSLFKARVNSLELSKARKGTPEYNEWLRKYKEKRGAAQVEPLTLTEHDKQRVESLLSDVGTSRESRARKKFVRLAEVNPEKADIRFKEIKERLGEDHNFVKTLERISPEGVKSIDEARTKKKEAQDKAREEIFEAAKPALEAASKEIKKQFGGSISEDKFILRFEKLQSVLGQNPLLDQIRDIAKSKNFDLSKQVPVGLSWKQEAHTSMRVRQITNALKNSLKDITLPKEALSNAKSSQFIDFLKENSK